MVERIEHLTAPPKIGRYYWVPTVRAWWNHLVSDWPVVGPLHEDRRFFNFPHPHYHVDRRFITLDACRKPLHYDSEIEAAQVQPVSFGSGTMNPGPPPPLVWRKRRCRRVDLPNAVAKKAAEGYKAAQRLFAAYADKSLLPAMLCPHRGVSLANEAVIDGVIACPLHGLRFCAASGRALKPEETPALIRARLALYGGG